MTDLMNGIFVLALVWGCTVWFFCLFRRRWWTAVRTGRWSHGGGHSYSLPKTHYTFGVYDRLRNPFMYRVGVIMIPVLFLFFLGNSVLLTMGFIEHLQHQTPVI
jgi:hypothetical protein